MLAPLLRSLLALALLGTFAQADAADRRVALVIGTSAYVSVSQLAFPCSSRPGRMGASSAFSFDLVASWKIDGPPRVALQAGQRNRLP